MLYAPKPLPDQRPFRQPTSSAQTEGALVAKMAAEGRDPQLVRVAITLMRGGRVDLIGQIIAGKLSVARAAAMARGRQ